MELGRAFGLAPFSGGGMKHGKALISHVYAGKRRKVGDVYPIRRTDYKLMQALGRVELVAEPERPNLSDYYITRDIPESPVKKKRGRPKKVKTDDA